MRSTVVVVAVAVAAAFLTPTVLDGWEAAMAPRAAMAASPALEVVVAAADDAHSGVEVAQWVTGTRTRGVTAVFKRTGAEAEAEEEEAEEEHEEEHEDAAKAWPTS